jgi:acyl-coenzyme A synthetase/AMP-(fatty) acid ligase
VARLPFISGQISGLNSKAATIMKSSDKGPEEICFQEFRDEVNHFEAILLRKVDGHRPIEPFQ